MKWLWRAGIAIAVLAAVAALAFLARHELMRVREGLPPFSHRASDRFDVMVAMADGVKLSTTVHLPDGEGPFPTVLLRSPYAQV